MICPKCGAEVEEGKNFCPACGAALSEPAEPAAEKKEGFLSKLPVSPKTLAIAAAAVVALIVIIAVIAGVAGGGNYQTYDSQLYITVADNTLYVVTPGGKVMKQDDVQGSQSTTRSADGTKAVVHMSSGYLYYVSDSGIKEITDDATNYYAISVDGSAVIYLKGGDIYIYRGDKSTKIDEGVSSYYCVSPNGGAVGYTKLDEDGTFRGFVWDGSVHELGKNKAPIALSNGAGYVYYYRFGETNSTWVQKKFNDDSRQKLADSTRTVNLNMDHTEAYLFDGEKTVYSAKGGEKQTIFKYSVSLVTPTYAKGLTTRWSRTCGLNTFKNALFYNSADEKIMKLASDLSTESVVKTGTTYYLANDGKTVTYLRDGKIRRVDASRSEPESTELAADVSRMFSAADGKLVYYVSDGEIYAKNGNGKAVKVTDDASGLIRLYNGNALLYTEDEMIYSSNGGKGKKANDFKETIKSVTTYGKLVIVTTSDATYYSTNGSKYTKLFE